MVHFTLSDRWMFIFVFRRRCECSCGNIDAIQALSVFLCCVCVWQDETFLYNWSTAAPTTSWCQSTEKHTWACTRTNTKTHRQACQMTEYINSVTRSVTSTTLCLTHRCTQTHKPTIIRHCVTVAVQGETEESFDRVSDNVQCLLLHSFSITRQYARSTLAAASSFSLADLHQREGLPISSLFSGFLE